MDVWTRKGGVDLQYPSFILDDRACNRDSAKIWKCPKDEQLQPKGCACNTNDVYLMLSIMYPIQFYIRLLRFWKKDAIQCNALKSITNWLLIRRTKFQKNIDFEVILIVQSTHHWHTHYLSYLFIPILNSYRCVKKVCHFYTNNAGKNMKYSLHFLLLYLCNNIIFRFWEFRALF